MFPSVEDFDTLVEHLGFGHCPRSSGNPRQESVYASESIYQKFLKCNGRKSCFISTQGYDNLQFEAGGRQAPKSIIYGLTFFDFDHDTKPENAFADAQRLSEFLTSINVAHWVQYSGAKGYHLQIVHRPTRFKFDHKDGSSEALREIVHQVQAHLKTSLGLNTLDAQTMGDPKRLCRFPFTRHVNRFGLPSERYATPIEVDMLATVGHDRIERMAGRPKFFLPKITGDKLTLKGFIERIGITLAAPETRIKPIIDTDFGFTDSQESTARYVAALDHRCMGVVNELKRRNPNHKARVHACSFAKHIGMSIDGFEQVWQELGQQVGYVDLHNVEYRRFQMESIFNNERMTALANCSTLKRDGCCVGAKCPKFIDSESFHEFTPPTKQRRWRKKR